MHIHVKLDVRDQLLQDAFGCGYVALLLYACMCLMLINANIVKGWVTKWPPN